MKKIKNKEPDFTVLNDLDGLEYHVYLKAKKMYAPKANITFKFKEVEIDGEYMVEYTELSGQWYLLFDESDFGKCPFANAFINHRIDKILLNG